MKKLIVANWKMNPSSRKEALKLMRGVKNIDVVVCPPFVYLPLLQNLKLGAQDCFWEEKGAFTGEISLKMLKDLKVKYVIVGHSERRHIIGETDEEVNKKLRAVLAEGLTPILCIGETKEQKGKAFQVLEEQLKKGLAKVKRSDIAKVIIAYEPVWAIGTSKPCCSDDALTASLFVRQVVSKMSSKKTGQGMRVLYGGSVSPENCQDYLESDWINGLLIGGASLDPEKLKKIA